MKMDKKDAQILSLLQENASMSLHDLARAVALSPTPCWRRVQKLRDEGVIRQQVVLCDPVKLNLGLTVFVTIRADQHNDAWTERFIEGVCAIEERSEEQTSELQSLMRI